MNWEPADLERLETHIPHVGHLACDILFCPTRPAYRCNPYLMLISPPVNKVWTREQKNIAPVNKVLRNGLTEGP